jgi:hypothetical protein
MWDAFFCDLNYLSADLVTGKSIPVLVAVATLPLDPNLLGTMVLFGVLLGSLVTLLRAWGSGGDPLLAWAVRFLNHAFAAFLSLSLLLRLAATIYPSGLTLSLLPAFCVVCQYVPERPATTLLLVLVSLALFFLCMAYEAAAVLAPAPRAAWGQRHLMMAAEHDGRIDPSVSGSLLHSLVVAGLAYYGTANHGPFYSSPGYKRYTSVQFVYNRAYSVWPTLTAAMLRAYVYLRTAWFSGNALHLMLHGRRGPLPCACLYVAVLLVSAAWSCTQITEQVLTVFVADKTKMRMYSAVALLAVGYLFRWGSEWGGFAAAALVAGAGLWA